MNTNLLVARKRCEMTQQQLADQSGVPQPDISRIEKHGWIPPLAVQQALAAALAVSVEALFGSEHQVAS